MQELDSCLNTAACIRDESSTEPHYWQDRSWSSFTCFKSHYKMCIARDMTSLLAQHALPSISYPVQYALYSMA